MLEQKVVYLWNSPLLLHLISDVIGNNLKLRIFQIQPQSYKDLFRLPKKTNRLQKIEVDHIDKTKLNLNISF